MYADQAISTTKHILSLRNYPRKPSYLLAALEDIYAHFGSVPKEAVTIIRKYFTVNELPSEISRSLFPDRSANRQGLKVCAGPLCIQAGADALASELAKLYGTSVKRQHCMGKCQRSPVVKSGSRIITDASPAKVGAMLDLPTSESSAK